MSATSTRRLLLERAAVHQVSVQPEVVEPLVLYFELLQHWNRTINLTALRADAEGIDRLLVEPLAAAEHVPHGKRVLDVGSGGGSPAIPLALATSAVQLGMAESRARKAAFLREAVRQLELQADVYTERIETLCVGTGFAGTWDLASARGIRVDSPLLAAVAAALTRGGQLVLFSSKPVALLSPFVPNTTLRLLSGEESYLILATASG